jgi:Outer membrane receptor proteins, mostly Fe transport
MPQDLGGIDIDRGPGNGATVGYATFGGTVGLHTKAPLDQTATTVYGSYGSFASRLYGAEFDTGTIHDYGDARAFLDYRQVQSNGYLSGAQLQRENLFFKAEKPFGTSTLLTVVAMKNRINGSYDGYPGATSYPYVAVNNGSGPYTSNLPGQMQVFGPNYGYSSNPKSQAYSGYFPDPVSTDFEYIGLNTRFAGVHLDDKVYTYAYYHNGQAGADPNGGNYDYGTLNGPFGSPGDGTFPSGAGSTNGTQCDGTTCLYPDNVPGDHGAVLFYRNWGNLLRLTQNLGPGQLGYGLWANYQSYYRFQSAIDLTNGGGYNFNPSKSPQSAIQRQIYGTFVVAQPYLQYAWHLTPALTVTPGIKYAWFRRSDKAPINQKTETPSNYAQVFKKFLPSIDIHYLLQRHWSAYIQAAKGYLAPNENLFYVPNPAVSTQGATPESTTNYQIGTTWQTRRLTVSADLYAINFSNQTKKITQAGITYFTNVGGVHYRGAETEATLYVGSGFSLYGNASYNKATTISDHLQLPGVPKVTGAGGVIFNRGPLYASLIAKYVGANFGDTANDAAGNSIGIYGVAPNTVVNGAINYTFRHSSWLPRYTKIGLQVFNLFDNRKISALAGYTSGNVPLFYSVAGRSIMASTTFRF